MINIYKTKIKIEKFIFGFLSFAGFISIGACLGMYLIIFEDTLKRNLTSTELLMYLIGISLILYISYFVNICLHEVGHMIFGLLTGYKFNSIRFGKLMLAKNDGKLRICRFNMPGTGGQCIMSAPKKDIDVMPVVLYNLGGLIINLITFLLGIGIFFTFKTTSIIVSMVSLIFALVALIILITNGIPFAQLGTDGANAIILHKDKIARKAFCNQLDIMYYMSNNYSIREMPEELFAFDESIAMNNPLITSQALNYYNYLSAKKMYGEAKRIAMFILENTKSINQLQEQILYGELIFIATVIDKEMDRAKELYHLHKKSLKSFSGFISIQRVMYAYFSLVEPDEKKAKKFSKRFKSSIKKYPYPKDAEIEQEQFDMILHSIKGAR